MTKTLDGSVAVVTGASKGIGKAIAFALVDAGLSVVLAARSEKELENVGQKLREKGGRVLVVPTDVSVESDVRRLIEQSMKEFGIIDVLVNNAGYGIFTKVAETKSADYDGMMNVNLRGAFLCSRAVLPIMMNQRRGAIINIASLAGKNSIAGGAVYAASKWGLIGFSRSLMLEVRDFNIRVMTICPGSVNTAFSDHSTDGDTIIQPADVADAVVFALRVPERSNVSEIDIRPTLKPKY